MIPNSKLLNSQLNNVKFFPSRYEAIKSFSGGIYKDKKINILEIGVLAGSVGISTRGGEGGVALAVAISGSSLYYAGGGGGGAQTGRGGYGGGVQTGQQKGGGGNGNIPGSGYYGHSGSESSGGGGGGGYGSTAVSQGGTEGDGGSGGSGIVIIRYPGTVQKATGGEITTDGTNMIHTFRSSGTFTTTLSAESPKATGGYITTDGTYWIHTFNTSGTFTPNQSLTVDYLVIAGLEVAALHF